MYNPFLVYCCELAPGTVSLTGDRAQGNDSKHDSHYSTFILRVLYHIYIKYRPYFAKSWENLNFGTTRILHAQFWHHMNVSQT